MDRLSDYPWETRYSSATHDLIRDFFIPALSRSRFYYRIAGYFSSTSIAAAFRGISAFIKNGEKMYLIIGSELSKEDVEAINRGIKGMSDVLNKKWEECVADFKNDIIRKRFELLSWLVANDKIEIKIGVNKDINGRYMSSEESKFHEKILIFEDYKGNMIQVDGSINETWKAWKKNRESFCVHKSWIRGNEEFIKTAKDDFDRVWNNLDSSCEAMDMPQALKQNIISIRPKNRPNIEDEIDFTYEELEEIAQNDGRELRKEQLEAIESWFKNNCIGVLEMATGTGKTFTALSAIKRKELNSRLLIIAAPQKELLNQWADDCEKVFAEDRKRIVLCDSDTDWKDDLSREIRQSKRESSLCIIIVTFDTMRLPDFLNKVYGSFDESYIIIDEVHEIGSFENRKLLKKLSNINVRLGLSATPDRVWDEDGNKAIKEYFNGNPIFRWGIEKAINPPEGYKRCLCPYKYYIHDSSLSDKELESYEEISLKIKRKIAILTRGGKINIKNVEDEPALKILLFKRADIIKECQDNYRVLDEILKKDSHSLTKCIIYCNDEKHMDEVTRRVLNHGLSCRKFYGNMWGEEREMVFDHFKNDDVQFLIAIKCLDQGIDLPLCNSAIILASSKNPREYVQRRGRILRLHEGKEFSIIHDFFVFPCPLKDLKSGKVKLSEYEAQLLKNQLDRIKIFTENCMNKAENYLKILDFGSLITESK